ncbi:unnamed protein product [Malus baccata var. baccata]
MHVFPLGSIPWQRQLLLRTSKRCFLQSLRLLLLIFRCQANEIAYKLAGYSLTVNHDCIWIESPPDLTLDVLIEDAPLP